MSEEHFEQVTIPHNREAEEACLGSVLIDPECFDEVELPSSRFYVHRHRWIWEAFEHLRSNNTNIDFLTVCSHLEKAGRLAEVGGAAYLTGLLNQVPTSLHIADYAQMVIKTAERREYLDIANNIAQGAMNDTLDVPVIMDRMIQQQHGHTDSYRYYCQNAILIIAEMGIRYGRNSS